MRSTLTRDDFLMAPFRTLQPAMFLNVRFLTLMGKIWRTSASPLTRNVTVSGSRSESVDLTSSTT